MFTSSSFEFKLCCHIKYKKFSDSNEISIILSMFSEIHRLYKKMYI